jgi:type VI secretion system protein ImpH
LVLAQGLDQRYSFDNDALIVYSGAFSHYPRNAVSLSRILADYFETTIRVHEYQGHWMHLDPSNQTRMPSNKYPFGLNCSLGQSTIIGDRLWNVESKFRIVIGPVSYADFLDYMPTGDRLVPLAQLVRQYVGIGLEFDVQVILRKEEIPRLVVGDERQPRRLGYNTWLQSRPAMKDADQAVFQRWGLPTRTESIN